MTGRWRKKATIAETCSGHLSVFFLSAPQHTPRKRAPNVNDSVCECALVTASKFIQIEDALNPVAV
jgi:hypothetical protein